MLQPCVVVWSAGYWKLNGKQGHYVGFTNGHITQPHSQMHERYMQEWIEHDLTGAARPTLVPNIISYSVIHSSLPVTHLSAAFDNFGKIMI